MNTGRKTSGGKYHSSKKKSKHRIVGQEISASLGETKRKLMKGMGGNERAVILRTDIVNVKTKNKIEKAEIKNVVETPQNRFLARQNRLLKGAIIETSLGKAKITNRPSREGMVNAVLVEE